MLVHLDDQYNIVFTTSWGSYKYLRMPFGLLNDGLTFQRAIDHAFDDLIGKILHFEHHVSIPQYHYLLTTKQGWQGEKDKFGGRLGAAGSHLID